MQMSMRYPRGKARLRAHQHSATRYSPTPKLHLGLAPVAVDERQSRQVGSVGILQRPKPRSQGISTIHGRRLRPDYIANEKAGDLLPGFLHVPECVRR